ncbi:hypothetical protein E2C01_015397 [Portunus trituberculatus]|uniref:Uncharacterized protein n=1 Tax=Portunus trituberculatus TaxID=210409 RepID=A0A5B7DMV8_PORTR|nr:hypothetical protein [Portunus trituberculatus]
MPQKFSSSIYQLDTTFQTTSSMTLHLLPILQ